MDCNTPLEKIVSRCKETGINCLAIADHGTVEGALKLQAMAPFTIIVAEEILTPYGEIMGMFLKETIPSGMTVEQTISRIREQGGLVCIPHPFDGLRPSALDTNVIEKLAGQIDVLEVFNAKALTPKSLGEARLFAEKFGIKQSAGSDAHNLGDIGIAYVEMPEFKGKRDFLCALGEGRIYGRRINPLMTFAHSAINKLRKGFNS